MTSAPPAVAAIANAGDAALLHAVVSGKGAVQRRALARAITLLESTRADHRERADALLMALPQRPAGSFRLGVSGVPGVGKSTFIEALGLLLIGRGHRVAVLAVDPSSTVSGGSILGDKTRMDALSIDAGAFVRPTPSGGALGGVAAATREAMLVVEAAGYDITVVETVGVGQSEAAVAGMTDMFLLLQLPNAGDDLQAIKKGVMEHADLVVVNKADLDPHAADRAAGDIRAALAPAREPAARPWQPLAITMSALDAGQVASVWAIVERFRALQGETGAGAARRREQGRAWLWERIDAGLRAGFRAHPEVRRALPATLAEIEDGRVPVTVAARRLLAAYAAP